MEKKRELQLSRKLHNQHWRLERIVKFSTGATQFSFRTPQTNVSTQFGVQNMVVLTNRQRWLYVLFCFIRNHGLMSIPCSVFFFSVHSLNIHQREYKHLWTQSFLYTYIRKSVAWIHNMNILSNELPFIVIYPTYKYIPYLYAFHK